MHQLHIRRFALGGAAVGISVFLLYLVLGLYFPGSSILQFGREDGPVEALAALLWAGASLTAVIRLSGQREARIPLVFWAALSFVCMGEEVSWFQRYLGVATPPDLRGLNGQGEFNIHNLNALNFGRALNPQIVFQLGFLGYFLILPLLMASERLRIQAARWGYSAPDRPFFAMIWTVIGSSYLLQALGSPAATRVTAETRETFFAFVVLSYVYFHLGVAPSLSTRPARTASSSP